MHIAARNFDIPSRAELILWRCATVYSTALGASIVIFGAGSLPSLKRSVSQIYLVLLSVLYVLARLFLLIEIFRTLCFLPQSAFVSTWALNVPHLALIIY